MIEEVSMNKKILNQFRQALTDRRNSLVDWLYNSPAENTKRVCECEVVQDGQIAEENIPILADIGKTIEKIDSGEFGKCCRCDGEVESERLQIDYSTNVCLDHYSDVEIRELERDLELASKVQKHLLPHTLPAVKGIEINAISHRQEY